MRAAPGRRRGAGVVALVVAVLALTRFTGWGGGAEPGADGIDSGDAAAVVRARRAADVYGGVGAWVDLYDHAAVGVGAVDRMADAGVHTLYLQAARDAGAGAPAVAEPERTGALLRRAHERGLRVVGWYLPRFGDVDRDLAFLRAVARFEAGGERFDGVGVDIEWTRDVPADDIRTDRLLALSRRLRSHIGDRPVGAIVPPPTQLEVVNPGLWPDFPWRRLAPDYDAWLPMAYWTLRTPASGFRDPARYVDDSLVRLRRHLGADAPVHVIGGVGPGTTPGEVAAFAGAVAKARADGGAHVIGASLYDWASVPPGAQLSPAALRAPAGRAVTGTGAPAGG